MEYEQITQKRFNLEPEMQYERITPKSYPVNLVEKDWSERELYIWGPVKSFPSIVHDMEVLEDDVWIVTSPKCGTTWMQELVWLLMNNCDFETALSEHLELRSPYLEFDFMIHRDEETALKTVQESPSPRVIKSHFSLALLPHQLWQGKAKVIYVNRNPKDAWVSSYYHSVTLGFCYGETLEHFFTDCMDDKTRNLIEHAAEFYQLRNEPWIYYTSFERMKRNLRGVIEDLCKFLDKTVTEEQMEQLLKHLSFEEMKKNPTTNHVWESSQYRHKNFGKESYNFVRKGKVNGYKEELPPELIEQADIRLAKKLEKNKITLEELLLDNVE